MIGQENILESKKRHQEEFLKHFLKAENIEPATYKLKRGVYIIEVAECLFVAEYWANEPEVVVVRDNQGRIFAVPEDRSLISRGRLVSRWDIQKGMKLRVTVNKEGVPEVLILEN